MLVTHLNNNAITPTVANNGSAGFDLYACIKDAFEYIEILPGKTVIVNTKIAIALPAGTVGLICSRSGLSANHGIFVLNSPGILDENYRGEIKIILCNMNNKSYKIAHGDRIAQLVITNYLIPKIKIVDKLEKTNRNINGFGSTGY